MKKKELARLLADDAQLSTGEAADCLDQLFYRIAKKLRRAKVARLPGLGSVALGLPAENIVPGEQRPARKKGGSRTA